MLFSYVLLGFLYNWGARVPNTAYCSTIIRYFRVLKKEDGDSASSSSICMADDEETGLLEIQSPLNDTKSVASAKRSRPEDATRNPSGLQGPRFQGVPHCQIIDF